MQDAVTISGEAPTRRDRMDATVNNVAATTSRKTTRAKKGEQRVHG
jgi:hypothetical protein